MTPVVLHRNTLIETQNEWVNVQTEHFFRNLKINTKKETAKNVPIK